LLLKKSGGIQYSSNEYQFSNRFYGIVVKRDIEDQKKISIRGYGNEDVVQCVLFLF
jgi:hypothetical protein